MKLTRGKWMVKNVGYCGIKVRISSSILPCCRFTGPVRRSAVGILPDASTNTIGSQILKSQTYFTYLPTVSNFSS